MLRCQADAKEGVLDVAFFLDNKAKTTKQTNKQFLQTWFLSRLPANLEVLCVKLCLYMSCQTYLAALSMDLCEDKHRRCHSPVHDA